MSSPSLKFLQYFRPRLIDALRGYDKARFSTDFTAGITVFCLNRTGILSDITQALSDNKVAVDDVRIKYHGDQTAKIEMTVSTHSLQELNTVIYRIRGIQDVVDVTRTKG